MTASEGVNMDNSVCVGASSGEVCELPSGGFTNDGLWYVLGTTGASDKDCTVL